MPRGGKIGNSGGKKGRSGAKSKAEQMGLAALLDKCWTPQDREDCIAKLAEKAKLGDMEAVKLLMAYTFGKPKENLTLSNPDGSPLLEHLARGLVTAYGNSKQSSAPND